MKAIVTVPPYAPFLKEVANHTIVSGLRLNTVMPVKEPLEDVLCRLQEVANGKNVFVDLKARQLRTSGYFVPPYTEVRISHRITVKTPVTAYFGNGQEHATVAAVDGDRLIFLEGPQRVVGPGESVNIPHKSLVIQGNLTDTDKAYIDACLKVDLHDYMLSFVESIADIADLRSRDSKANVVAKIESAKGLDFVRDEYKGNIRLMAARGDLFIELDRPHKILDAVETIIAKDADAIAASRILSSLSRSLEPDCNDLSDVAYLIKTGYKTLMLGDEVCLRRESVISALNVLDAINRSCNIGA